MKMRKERMLATMAWLIIFLALALVASKPAVNTNDTEAAGTIHKTESPPVIDGRLDDPVWQLATRFDRFMTFKPDYGKVTSEDTVVLMAYDRKHIYFGFDCRDSEPPR
jgi:hypothetical protein